jgi:tape measure domain-containing protein
MSMAEQTNILSFVFKVVNMATGPLAEVANSLRGTADNVTKFGERISTAMTGFQRLNEIGNSINENLSKPIKEFRDSMIAAAADEESMMVSLSALMGSKDKAKELSDALGGIATATGRSKDEMMSVARSMIPFGASTATITSIIGTFSDASLATGISIETMIGAMTKAVSREGLSGRELRGIAAQVPIYETLAKVMGKTSDEVKDMSTIPAENYLAAMKILSSEGGRYFNQTKEQSATMKGIMNRWAQSTQELKEKIGDALTNALGTKATWENRIKMLNAFGEYLQKFIEKHPGVTKIVGAVMSFLIILGPLVIGLGMLCSAIAAVSAVGAPMWGMIIGVVAAIALLVFGAIWLYKHWGNLWQSFKDAGPAIKILLILFGALVIALGVLAVKMVMAFWPLLLIIGAIAVLAVGIKWLIENWGNLGQAFSDASPLMKAVIVIFGLLATAAIALGIALAVAFWPVTLVVLAVAALIAIGWLLYDNWDAVCKGFSDILSTVSDAFTQLWTDIQQIGETIGNFFAEVWDGVVQTVSGAINSITDLLPDFLKEKLGFKITAENVGTPAKTVSDANKIKGDVNQKVTITLDQKGKAEITDAQTIINDMGGNDFMKFNEPVMLRTVGNE